MDLLDAAAIARAQMDRHGLGHWAFKWDRAVRRLGACRPKTLTISLSRPLVQRAPEAVVRNTILHEIAHALVGPGHGHNWVWRDQARAIGCSGDRCFTSVDVAPIPTAYVAVCGSCRRSIGRHRVVKRKMWCRRCGPEKGLLTFARRTPELGT